MLSTASRREALVALRRALLVLMVVAAGLLGAICVGCRPASPTADPQPIQDPAAFNDLAALNDLAAFNRAVGLLEQYKYADAAEALAPVVAAHPDWTAARFNYGLALLNDQKPEAVQQAEKELLRVLQQEPDHRWALFCLAKLYQTGANTEKAVELSGKLHQLDKNDLFVAFHYGNNLVSVGKMDEATKVLESLVQRDPGFVSGIYSLGNLYRRTRQPAKTQPLMERFKQLNAKELVAGSYQVADPYGGHGKYYTAIAADGLPVPAARMTPAPKVVFSPDVVKIDVTLKPWKWTGGEVQTPGVAVGDLDGDGDLDLVVCGVGDDAAAVVLLGDGKGGFTVGPRLADKAVSPCLGDVNNDGHLDLWLGRAGENLLLLNDGKGNFTKAKDHPAASGSTLTVCARMLDFDSDGDLDLLAVRIAGGNVPPGARQTPAALAVYLNRSPFRFSEEPKTNAPDVAKPLETAGKPIAPVGQGEGGRQVGKDAQGASGSQGQGASGSQGQGQGPGDSESGEEDVDKGGFEDVAGNLGLAQEKTPLSAVLYDDFDNDRDIDLLLLPSQGTPLGWENFREGKFRIHDAASTGLDRGGAVGATTGDPFKTGFRAVLMFTGKQLGLFHNRGHWKFEKDAEFAAQFGSLGGTCGQFVDIDNDGDLDLIVADAHRRDGTRGPALLINDWPNRRFVDAGDVDPGNLPAAIGVEGNAACVAGDFNGDGTCDLLLLPCGGQPQRILNLTQGGNWLALDLIGDRGQQKMTRSPNVAIGARVEVHAGTVSQQHVVGAPAGATAMPPLRVHAGLGAEKQVQWLRILWPDSVLQAELELAANKTIRLVEENRRTTSCPHLFAWTGRHFEFVSDFGGVGGLGYRTSPNAFAQPDATEYVVLPKLVPLDGDYVLQALEPLEEIVYLDELKLVAVDHPVGTSVHPHEMAAVSAGPPPFEIFCYDKSVEPMRAVDHRGNDVAGALSRTDRVYAAGIEPRRSFTGFAKNHFVDLDFGDRLDAIPAATRRVLMLDGWVEYSTSTSNYAAAQARLCLKAPSVSVRRNGRWVELLHEVGYPAGINHRMTLDLTGKLQPGDREIRVASNMEIYWDRIFLAPVREDARLAVREVAARSGHLHFRGYPREYSPDGRQPNLLDYANIDSSTTWLRMPGAYTRYGDVTELLASADDCFVIMAPGEEVTARFPAAALGPVPAGFTRTFLLKADSYCKDMDLYTGGHERVEPLPFHAMKSYPYSPDERYPDTEKTRAYRAKYNTRIIP